ncbi:hypothetical protein SAMN04489812_5175 [Microlunatus soli]|uniref:Uncharacterized protein n=1 Tax=Microlunatus soli TaxID=630515 RepID=A0A1H1ZEN7_9ACTN|nr:hypothetical protein SAMN04489812_5175 [Microlunatus soli]
MCVHGHVAGAKARAGRASAAPPVCVQRGAQQSELFSALLG